MIEWILAGLLTAAPTDAGAHADAQPTALVASARADAPTVTARVDKAEAHVGDALHLSITAVSPITTPVILPENVDLSPFTELSRHLEEKDLGDGKMRREFELTVAAYQPGAAQIPAVEVTYFGKGGEVLSARTQPIAVTITSLIANEPEPKLKENAGPVPVIQRDYLYAYIAGGLA
ncbi:MAG: BatD family protein, partial [Polyangia bacterium]